MKPEPALIAGFDAGQTHTRCRLAALGGDGHLEPLAEGTGSGVSHLAAADAEERFANALVSSLKAAIGALPRAAGPVRSAAIGASGIELDTAEQRRAQELATRVLALPQQRALVTGDERTALGGAFGSIAGILVISGTGSIALGQNQQGRQHRCGGWGWLLDEAGSAFDLGRDGLALSLRMADGRVPETPLRRRLWEALEAEIGTPLSPQLIKSLVVDPAFGPAGFARLAPWVDDLAAAGDRGAIAIIERSAAALVALVATVAAALELEAPAVCPQGGALRHLEQLRNCFRAALQKELPAARMVEPLGDACAGALSLAASLLSQG